MEDYHFHILVCDGSDCRSKGGAELFLRLEKEIAAHSLLNRVKLVKTGCFGLCAKGPIVIIYPQGSCYCHVTADDVPEIVESHLKNSRIVTRLLDSGAPSGACDNASCADSCMSLQTRHILRRIDDGVSPEDIDAYIKSSGYEALGRVLTSMTPAALISEIAESGLRGRSGRGFKTAVKWQFAAKSNGFFKYIYCTSDDGDPAAFIDRTLLEGDPHAVIEGMILAGFATGAPYGRIDVRTEYPIVARRLQIAIRQAREYGFLGHDIFDSGMDFDIELHFSGDERVLPDNAIDSSAETLANIPYILAVGAHEFRKIGTAQSPGTKIFSLTGKIKNGGVIEVPLGTKLGYVLHDIGGDDGSVTAVLLGGAVGGFLPRDMFETALTHDALSNASIAMGSASIVALNSNGDILGATLSALKLSAARGCKDCAPCRLGLARLIELLQKIIDGKGCSDDIEQVRQAAEYMHEYSRCAMGRAWALPVLSSLKYFKSEYLKATI